MESIQRAQGFPEAGVLLKFNEINNRLLVKGKVDSKALVLTDHAIDLQRKFALQEIKTVKQTAKDEFKFEISYLMGGPTNSNIKNIKAFANHLADFVEDHSKEETLDPIQFQAKLTECQKKYKLNDFSIEDLTKLTLNYHSNSKDLNKLEQLLKDKEFWNNNVARQVGAQDNKDHVDASGHYFNSRFITEQDIAKTLENVYKMDTKQIDTLQPEKHGIEQVKNPLKEFLPTQKTFDQMVIRYMTSLDLEGEDPYKHIKNSKDPIKQHFKEIQSIQGRNKYAGVVITSYIMPLTLLLTDFDALEKGNTTAKEGTNPEQKKLIHNTVDQAFQLLQDIGKLAAKDSDYKTMQVKRDISEDDVSKILKKRKIKLDKERTAELMKLVHNFQQDDIAIAQVDKAIDKKDSQKAWNNTIGYLLATANNTDGTGGSNESYITAKDLAVAKTWYDEDLETHP